MVCAVRGIPIAPRPSHGPKHGERREAYLHGFDRAPSSAESAAKHISTALTAHGPKRGQHRERM